MSPALPCSLFFCFGPVKSGTTLLQVALNSHPEISCPSEHNFATLSELMGEALSAYNENLQVVDRRTGGQGATLIDGATAARIFRGTVEAIVQQAAGGKPIMGANDNSMLRNLPLYDQVFEQPKMIAIFRNPIDQGLSAWHHNLRLAEEEKDPRHREMMRRHGDLAGWLRHMAEQFRVKAGSWRSFVAGRDHVCTLRFEDLVTERARSLREVFGFLGAAAQDEVIEMIAGATAFESMRARSRYPGFFRRAATDFGGEEVSAELRRELLTSCADELAWLGYRIP
ncbi:MAG: sulfotransferase [Steroidobacteraceae bacterium]